MNSISSRKSTKASCFRSSERRMLASFTISSRACSGRTRTKDEMEFSVLKRKWGLIWLCRASRRACRSNRSCSSSLSSMRVAFQILIGIATAAIVPAYTATSTQKVSPCKKNSRPGNARPICSRRNCMRRIPTKKATCQSCLGRGKFLRTQR